MNIYINKEWLKAKILDAMEDTVRGDVTSLVISREIVELCQEFEIDIQIKHVAVKKGIQIVVGELF